MNQHRKLQEWVEEMARMCGPDQIVWIDGSEEEKERLTQEAAATGEVILLNPRSCPAASITARPPTTLPGPKS